MDKKYYAESHPSLSNFENRTMPQPVSVQRIRVPDEISKYKKTATITKEINNLAAGMSSSQYDYYFDIIKKLKDDMSNPTQSVCQDLIEPNSRSEQQTASNVNNNPSTRAVSDTQPNAVRSNSSANSSSVPYEPSNQASSMSLSTDPIQHTQSLLPNRIRFPSPENANRTFSMQSSTDHTQTSFSSEPVPPVANHLSYGSKSQDLSSIQNRAEVLSSSAGILRSTAPHILQVDIGTIKLPSKINTIGTKKKVVVDTKKKGNVPIKRKPNEHLNIVPAKRKFIDLSATDQAMKIVQWLTNKTEDEILRKKVSYDDLIQDSNTFNRLRNDGIDLDGIKTLVDKKCFHYLTGEMRRLDGLIWGCTKCKRNLNGEQIMCNGCLDWYHISCVSSRANPFFCLDCK